MPRKAAVPAPETPAETNEAGGTKVCYLDTFLESARPTAPPPLPPNPTQPTPPPTFPCPNEPTRRRLPETQV